MIDPKKIRADLEERLLRVRYQSEGNFRGRRHLCAHHILAITDALTPYIVGLLLDLEGEFLEKQRGLPATGENVVHVGSDMVYLIGGGGGGGSDIKAPSAYQGCEISLE